MSAGETKPRSYFAQTRAEIVEGLPRPLGRVLDVGCGAGAGAAALRAAGATEIIGIEPDPGAAARAGEVYDRVLTGTAEERLPDLDGSLGTILCHDVLEHLPDPVPTLRRLRELVADGGHLSVSVPNARQFGLVLDLALRGTFGYSDWGHRDRTHLRWFTRRDLEATLAETGWRPTRVACGPIRPVALLLARATRGLSAELTVHQIRALAQPA